MRILCITALRDRHTTAAVEAVLIAVSEVRLALIKGLLRC